jgi:beta-lactamase regulating signal transducer with metallopeptidase domain
MRAADWRTADLLLTFLLNAGWQVPLVAAIGTLSSLSIRRAPARFRHLLWLAVLAASLLLPLASVLPGHTLSRPNPSSAEIVGTASRAAAPPTLFDLAWLGRDGSAPAPARTWPPSLVAALGGAYATLVLALAFRLCASCLAVRRLHRASFAPALPAEISATLLRCRSAFGLGEVALRFSSEVASPVTFGFLRPAILVPEGFFHSTSRDEQTAALGHEAAHIARGDYLINLLVEIVLLPIAFHPAAWFLRRRLAETREMACDEATIEKLLGPRTYARSLLSLAALGTGLSRPTPTLGVFDAGTLEVRMKSLIEVRSRMGALQARIQLSLAVLLVAALGLAMSGLAVQATAGEAATAKSAARLAASPAPAEWAPFLGKWIGDVPVEAVIEKDGTKRAVKEEEWPHFADVEIQWVGGAPRASLTLIRVQKTATGFQEEADPAQTASEVKLAGKTLAFRLHKKGFRQPNGQLTSADTDWTIDLISRDEGRLRLVRHSYFTPARARGENVPPPPPELARRRAD